MMILFFAEKSISFALCDYIDQTLLGLFCNFNFFIIVSSLHILSGQKFHVAPAKIGFPASFVE